MAACALRIPSSKVSSSQISLATISVGLTTPPVEGGADSTLGPGQAYEPWFAVDIYDTYEVPAVIPGFPANGNSSFAFLNATFVARGFTVPSGSSSPEASGAVNQSVNSSCGSVQSGPFFNK